MYRINVDCDLTKTICVDSVGLWISRRLYVLFV